MWLQPSKVDGTQWPLDREARKMRVMSPECNELHASSNFTRGVLCAVLCCAHEKVVELPVDSVPTQRYQCGWMREMRYVDSTVMPPTDPSRRWPPALRGECLRLCGTGGLRWIYED